MDRIVVAPSGLWLVQWDKEKRESFQRPISPNGLARKWSYPGEFENMTVGALFNLMSYMSELGLLDELCGSWVLEGVKLFKALKSKPSVPRKKLFLEVKKQVEIREQTKLSKPWGSRDRTIPASVSTNAYCTGRGGTPKRPGKYWGLSLTPITELFDCPIVVRKEAEVRWQKYGTHKDTILGTKYEVDWTLGEILTAIFDEACFFEPKKQVEMKKRLMDDVAGIKAGTVKTYPIEDLFKKWDKTWKADAAKAKKNRDRLYRERNP